MKFLIASKLNSIPTYTNGPMGTLFPSFLLSNRAIINQDFAILACSIRLDEKENLTYLRIFFLTGANNEDRLEDLGLDKISSTLLGPLRICPGLS